MSVAAWTGPAVEILREFRWWISPTSSCSLPVVILGALVMALPAFVLALQWPAAWYPPLADPGFFTAFLGLISFGAILFNSEVPWHCDRGPGNIVHEQLLYWLLLGLDLL